MLGGTPTWPNVGAEFLDPTGITLTPSPYGRDCKGNGEWPGVECCCDECDYYLVCFPDWMEREQG